MANTTVNIDVQVQSKSILELQDQLEGVNEELQEIGNTSQSLSKLDASIQRSNQQAQQFDQFLEEMVQLLGTVGVESKAFQKIEKDTEEAVKAGEKLADTTKDVGDEAKKAGKEATIFDDMKDKLSGVTSTVRKVIASFKTLKGAIAATGIAGLVIAIGSLVSYFKSSEEGSKKFAIALETVKLLFDDFVAVLGTFGETIVNAFESPGQAVRDFGQAVVDNIVERFNSLIEVATSLGSALVKLFKKDFSGALEDLKNSGKEMVDVFTGVDGTVDKIGETAVKTFTRVKEAIAEATVTATALITSQRALRDLQQDLTVQNANLRKQLEEQKRIAEDTTLDYETRKAALEELGAIQVKLAQNVATEAKATEDLLKLQIAQTDDYEKREELETQLAEATAARIQSETELQTVRQEAAKVTRELDLTELDRKKAINDMLNALELENIDNQFEAARRELDLAEQTALAELDLLKASEEEKQRVRDAYQGKREQLAKEEATYNEQLARAEENAKLDIVKQGFAAISTLVGEQSAAGKAAAVAAATIDSYQAFNNALAETPLPPPFPQIAAGIALAAGLANVKKIIQTKAPGETGGTAAPNLTRPGAPSFNASGAMSGQAQSLLRGSTPQAPNIKETPIRAYVLAEDVQSGTEARDRLNLKRNI